MPTYRVVIKGVQQGQDSESVLNGLAALVKKDAAVIRPILTSGYFVIKRSVDQPTATKYKEVLENVGCACEIEMEITPESDDLPAQRNQRINSPTISPSPGNSGSSQAFCPECGASVAGGQKFCTQCGRNLTAFQPELVQHRDNLQPVTNRTPTSFVIKMVTVLFGFFSLLVVIGAFIGAFKWGPSNKSNANVIPVIVDAEDTPFIVVDWCSRTVPGYMECNVTNKLRDRSYGQFDFGYEVFNVQGVKINSRTSLYSGNLGPGETVRTTIFLGDDANKVFVGSYRAR